MPSYGLRQCLVAPQITEAASLPNVERDRVVVVSVARFRRLAQPAAVGGAHDVDPERGEEYRSEDNSAEKGCVHVFGSAAISLSYFAMMTFHE